MDKHICTVAKNLCINVQVCIRSVVQLYSCGQEHVELVDNNQPQLHCRADIENVHSKHSAAWLIGSGSGKFLP